VIKVLYQAKVTASSGSTVNMRDAASSSGEIIKQIPLNTIVDVVEETNADWLKIGYQGKVGYMMSKFLKKVADEGAAKDDENVYYVRIKCATAAEAKRLAELLNKAEAE
jgi:uncharacterized protein YgiM (DUF1202 family)